MQNSDDKSQVDLSEWIMTVPAESRAAHKRFWDRFNLTRIIGHVIMVASAILFLVSVCDLIFGIVSKWL